MDILSLIGIIIAPVTGVVSWLAGTRSRKNSVYQEMLATIHTLTEQNTAYNLNIIKLQDEIIEVRRENAELKAGQEEMTRQMQELKQENIELKQIITKKK